MIYNPFPEVNLPFGKDNKWFVYLFEALIRVDRSFIEYEIQDVDDVGALKIIGTNTHLERVFAYELYRQWMNYLEEKGIRNLVVNGEIGKFLKDEFARDFEHDEKKGRDNFPDLVLHKSQGNDDNQIMVCEIKREDVNNADLLLDLYKLSCYLSEQIFWKKPFKYGVFILEGKTASLSKLKIKPGTTTKFKGREITIEEFMDKKELRSTFQNIVCVFYDGTNLNYGTFDNYVDTITKED